MTGDKLREIYELLYQRFGPQHWWPCEERFEMIVGAILTQNTNWGNVEKALANLKAEKVLTPEGLHGLDAARLGELIRPAGYYNIKARRLKNVLDWLFENYDSRLENLEEVSTDRLREELLSVKGVGPETADSILLYAFDRPMFVIDAYTARVAVRHGLIDAGADYYQLQELFASNLPADSTLFNEYHALLVRVSKEFCRTKPLCRDCPLNALEHFAE